MYSFQDLKKITNDTYLQHETLLIKHQLNIETSLKDLHNFTKYFSSS